MWECQSSPGYFTPKGTMAFYPMKMAIYPIKMAKTHDLNEHRNLVLIALVSSKDSDKTVRTCSITRAFVLLVTYPKYGCEGSLRPELDFYVFHIGLLTRVLMFH